AYSAYPADENPNPHSVHVWWAEFNEAHHTEATVHPTESTRPPARTPRSRVQHPPTRCYLQRLARPFADGQTPHSSVLGSDRPHPIPGSAAGPVVRAATRRAAPTHRCALPQARRWRQKPTAGVCLGGHTETLRSPPQSPRPMVHPLRLRIG